MPDQPAYANYLIPQSATSIIPQQMGTDYLSNLENQLNLNEQQQMNQLLAQNNQMGTASSGQTQFGLAGILGNTQNQFANAATNLAGSAAGQAGGQQFQQQYEAQQFQNALAELAQQAQNQQNLVYYQSQLFPNMQSTQPTFGQILGQSFAGQLPSSFIQGTAAGLTPLLSNGMGGLSNGNMFGGPMMQGNNLNLTPFGGQLPSGQYGAAFGSGNMGFGTSSMFANGGSF